ncbi:cadmium resistance protein [Methanobacterium sp. A39]|nr:cadmium resistance protein [Methanobacterium sp. A39]
MELIFLIFTAVAMFIATNLDDLFVLMIFFSNKEFTARQIVLGQYIGVMALMAISALSYFLKLVIPANWIGLLGILPILIGLKNLKDLKSNNDISANHNTNEENKGLFSRFRNSKSSLVALVSFTNGGDNIGVYIPLFVSIGLQQILVVISVFLVMISVWCYISFNLVENSILGDKIKKYGHIILPFVLIFLGIIILIRSL